MLCVQLEFRGTVSLEVYVDEPNAVVEACLVA